MIAIYALELVLLHFRVLDRRSIKRFLLLIFGGLSFIGLSLFQNAQDIVRNGDLSDPLGNHHPRITFS